MRVFLLLLFAADSAAESIVEKIDRALSEIPISVNKAELLANHELLQAHADDIRKDLQLSPEREEILHRVEAEVAQIQHQEHDNETIVQVNAQSQVGDLLYQSDIILTPQQAETIAAGEGTVIMDRAKRQAALNWKHWDNFQWDDNTLYYAFSPQIDDRTKSIVRKAANQWQKDSCVDLIESNKVEHYVLINMEPACSSFVGCLHQGPQRLRLGNGCHLIGTAAHELGHALGMFHTHSRHDRDQYIIINLKNVLPGKESQFNKETLETSNTYGIPFDYGSIMAYSIDSMLTYSQQNNKGAYTMLPVDSKYTDTMGSSFISFYDMLLLNTMYDCLKKCDGVQRSPARGRFKRETTRTITKTVRDKNGKTVTITRTCTSSGCSFSDNGFGNFGNFDNDLAEFLDPLGGLSRFAGLGGSGSIFGGSNGGKLKGEEGGSNGGSRLPGDGGSSSSSTGGKTPWWKLPSIGGLLPDWIWGAGWDWDHTAVPPRITTTTRRPFTQKPPTTTRRPFTQKPPTTTRRPTQKPLTTTRRPFTQKPPITPGRLTTTTTPPSGPSYGKANCANGGYPNPRDCSKCVCPGGYGGRLCNERPAGPGKVLQANTKWQKIETLVGYEGVRRTSEKDDFLFEYYWIQAPKGRKIEIKVDDITPDLETPGCYWFGVEVKAQRDQRLTGYRYCSAKYKGKTYKSEGNLVPIVMYSRIWPITMNLSYRLI